VLASEITSSYIQGRRGEDHQGQYRYHILQQLALWVPIASCPAV
jgi:hypothetical protein